MFIGKREECSVLRALEKGYTEGQITLMVDDTPLAVAAGGLVDEEDTVRMEEGDETEVCGDHGSTEVLSSPLSKSPPYKKKRSFGSIVRAKFNPLGSNNASAPPVAPPVSTSTPDVPISVPLPPSFGVGYLHQVQTGGFAGFAGFSSSSTLSTMGAGPSTPASTFCPSWGITSDADGQDPSFPSEFALHAFPYGMTSRLDGLEYSEVQSQYYSHATSALACAASLARRNQTSQQDVQKRAELAEAEAQKYKAAYEEVNNQMSALKVERDGFAKKTERYAAAEKHHIQNMDWMLEHGVRDAFQHCFSSDLFVDNALTLYAAIGEAGVEKGARLTRDKFNLTFSDEEIPGYQPGRGAAAEEALSAFDKADYVGSSGLDFSNYMAFRECFPQDAPSDEE